MDGPVLLTGAFGQVGTAVLDRLADAYEWRLFDRRPPDEPVPHETIIGDITDTDLITDAAAGATAVVHLAGDPRPEARWQSVFENNIHGTYTVFEAAQTTGVTRVVFASSNHVVGHYETAHRPDIYRPHDETLLDDTVLPRPGNLYGVSKATGELLGRYFHDEHGIEVVCVRIGNLTEDHPPRDYERGQAMWLSYRDCAHLFDCCLTADDIGYEIVYGISDNDRKFYSLRHARKVLGYQPRDNSADY